ncbi:ABC transporter substrate-binding protein [Comamonas aquatica]|uniref:ABC transporter substrate-binding protein n=1 Tax=Comamonas aquatica TaxID=225991 RepID=UPI0024497048|nr:ABC transporter substrate-binding protein [Comamonas aquatica]MDH1902926.1 ABC transporter substrate-binding protein [Comamonas aquatica]
MQRRHFLRSVSSLSAAAALVPAHTWAQGAKSALTPVKFTLDFKVTSQTAPFFLAAAKGYYAQEGLDVQIDVGAGSVASLTRVASGAYDLGLGDISALIEAHAKGSLPVQAVYQYYNRAPFVIIGRKDRGITTQMASLKGKKVAAAAVESTRRSWPMVAEQQKLGSDFFEWVTTDFSARDNVMVRGDVDAATYFHDSAVSLFQRMPPEQLSVLSYAEAGVHLYGNAIVVSTALMKDKPELVRGFLRATQRALLDALANPAEALAAVRAREPMLRDDQERARWAITRTYLANAETAQVGLGRIQPAVLQQQIVQIGKTFGLPQLPTVQAVWNTGFLPTAVQQGAGA